MASQPAPAPVPPGPATVASARTAEPRPRARPDPVRALRRTFWRARAHLRTRALEAIPFPVYELARLRSLDPFVARAAARSDHNTTGVHFLILAGVPMGDSGGGQRPAQLALEMLACGHRVTYVYRFASREAPLRRRHVAHENLTHTAFRDLSIRQFSLERRPEEHVIALCEMPLPEYAASVRYLRARGATALYDCIDDWDSSLGGGWYSRRAEDLLLREADALVASARSLQAALQSRSGRPVALLPNAANTRLFDRRRSWERPPDLPRARAIFTYVGSLWGEWFDWDWVVALARANPSSAVVLLGDYRGQCRQPPPNLHFLGLRPQTEIPAYLAHSDVCLIPFKVDRLVEAVSPLKIFEYLAMGRPVVASDMPEVRGLPGVRVARSAQELVDQVAAAQGEELDEAALDRFLAEHCWTARVRQLERLAGARPVGGARLLR